MHGTSNPYPAPRFPVTSANAVSALYKQCRMERGQQVADPGLKKGSLKEEEEEDRQIMSLGDSRIKRVRDRIAFLSMLTVRVVVLEYNQLHKKA